MNQTRGKIKPVLSQIFPYFSIIYPFEILMGRFQNILNKTLSELDTWIFQM